MQKTLCPNRWHGLYACPVYLSTVADKLLIDFAKNRDRFALNVPRDLPAYLASPIPRPKGSEPPEQATLTLLQREYPGMFVESVRP
ncbi:MAG TPA: hypothetical protein VLV87_01530 [Gammaproteobacteria bacterium]|nr:hypothetical protein [Gammaproteobacteria bacterium]